MSTGPLLQKPQPGGDNSRIAELSACKKSEPLTDHIHLCALRKGKLRMLGGQHRTGSTETVGTVCIARTGEHVCPPVRGIHQPLTERSRTAIQERRASWRSSSEPVKGPCPTPSMSQNIMNLKIEQICAVPYSPGMTDQQAIINHNAYKLKECDDSMF